MLNETTPVGALAPAPVASEIVAVQVVLADTATGEGEHVTAVVVVRGPTAMLISLVCSGPLESSTVTSAT